MSDFDIDLVSDLHIDRWSRVINNFPIGTTKYRPIKWNSNSRSKILIVAGDISDNLKISLDYLDSISVYYEHIIFVDGNHEHIYEYPNLMCLDDIYFQTKVLENSKLIFLPKQDFIINDMVIIGYSGWWNYSQGYNSGYFENWIEKLNNPVAEKEFFKNVKLRALEEYRMLQDKLNCYEHNKEIKKIIIVTHTLPLVFFAEKISTEFNTWFSKIKSTKIKYWFFGHTHRKYDKEINGVRYVCHPRGRPDDYNRENYKPLKMLIS